MTDAVLTRKLASIVAVDVAGYSAQAERDELATVAAIAALRQRIEACAASHGGRVFNSAGDGFMLEFPTASSALEAGAALVEDELALRIGVHVGEVSVIDNGDLLGHGVNIAARLQQMAQPRGVVASEDV
ncbi:MAG TPA: adenylate/guanylate cyclase domain-containing protein, partial [Terricaulis sp.]|nr:adenylate/guanylate cyclase domain-containing protein [Terricaulis sp.]